MKRGIIALILFWSGLGRGFRVPSWMAWRVVERARIGLQIVEIGKTGQEDRGDLFQI